MPLSEHRCEGTPLFFCASGEFSFERGAEKERRESAMVAIVQFPHSGKEFPCTKKTLFDQTNVTRWNAGDHCRRLVKHTGEYVNRNGQTENGELAFWTEWEANTISAPVVSTCLLGANCIHSCLYPDPIFANQKWTCMHGKLDDNCSGGCCETNCANKNLGINTDPCVFGSTFKYCLCRQDASPLILKNLDKGSLVVFGSKVESKFCLDTVFVVASGQDYKTKQSSISKLHASEEYKNLALDRFTGFSGRFYRGAVQTGPVEGMYSFTPAKTLTRVTPSCGARCVLDLQKINRLGAQKMFNLKSTQSVKHTEVSAGNRGMIKRVWDEIRRQVLANGFVLGVHFDWPTQRCVVKNGNVTLV